jgi:hypothetical protein
MHQSHLFSLSKDLTMTKVFCNDVNEFFKDFKARVKELEPDYPWDDENDTAFTYLWAIVEGYKGTRKACDDWSHAFETVECYRTANDFHSWAASRGKCKGYGFSKMEALADLYEKEGTAPYGRKE